MGMGTTLTSWLKQTLFVVVLVVNEDDDDDDDELRDLLREGFHNDPNA
jgi:hypothetical protein